MFEIKISQLLVFCSGYVVEVIEPWSLTSGYFRSGPQLEPTAGSHPVRPGGETPTLPVTYSLPRKISPDHYRPPSPPPSAAPEETRSQNLTVVAAGRTPSGHADAMLPLLVYPSGGTPNVSDLPAAAYQPSLIGGPLANSRPGGGGSSLSSVPGSELPQQISFRHQQAQRRLYIFISFLFSVTDMLYMVVFLC